jgi:hypothetical protein
MCVTKWKSVPSKMCTVSKATVTVAFIIHRKNFQTQKLEISYLVYIIAFIIIRCECINVCVNGNNVS